MLNDIKNKAIRLRKTGKSYPEIEKKMNVSRSTLSGWLSQVELTNKQKKNLYQNKIEALKRARALESKVHQESRLKRIKKIDAEAEKLVASVKITQAIGEMIFATFYLAEGSKKENSMIIANSNPDILKGLITLFRKVYNINESKFRCCLHLRNDQKEENAKIFWSKLLNIKKSQFIKTQFDRRTTKPTFKNYRGVCVVQYFDINLQRRILYLGDNILNKISRISGS